MLTVTRGAVGTAVMSLDGLYRYRLTRSFDDMPGRGPLCWVMLNPSTADAGADDATIRKCCGFARRWDFGGIVVINLFAYKSTDPALMANAKDPVGPENERFVREAASKAERVMVAWGNVPAALLARAAPILAALKAAHSFPRCLGRVMSGQPRHPLYVPYTAIPEEWP